ncbi:hypothetical protein MJO28_005190 [Puccinia striiformis f. sp. tritici]|uniref:Uncharacterized protein n=1 Tax=Puccinia striiformis f. sp. tritici TaxID=168172 RepID=A0ACC0EK02_9BASI|nr:hypothetical protein MJO28_005190 [Puccinia striiformis f. sp. tritici]
MRFALVAGALVLSASVSEARSVPPSPSKNSRTTLVRLQALNVRIGTPLSISKRTTVEGNASTSEDVLPNLNGSPSSTGTPKSRDPPMEAYPTPSDDGSRVHEYSQHDRKRRSILPALSQTLPEATNPLTSAVDDTLPQASPLLENMQFSIKPVNAAKKLSDQRESEPGHPSPVYIIKPVTSAATATLAQTVEASSGVINFEEPTTVLLRAIENYRQSLAKETPAGSAISVRSLPESVTLSGLPIPQLERSVEKVTHGVARISAKLSPLPDNTPAIGPIGSISISDIDVAGLSSQ